jgi:hypothetical protein
MNLAYFPHFCQAYDKENPEQEKDRKKNQSQERKEKKEKPKTSLKNPPKL